MLFANLSIFTFSYLSPHILNYLICYSHHNMRTQKIIRFYSRCAGWAIGSERCCGGKQTRTAERFGASGTQTRLKASLVAEETVQVGCSQKLILFCLHLIIITASIIYNLLLRTCSQSRTLSYLTSVVFELFYYQVCNYLYDA